MPKPPKYTVPYTVLTTAIMDKTLEDLVIKYRLPSKTWLLRECVYRGLMAMYQIDIDEQEREELN